MTSSSRPKLRTLWPKLKQRSTEQITDIPPVEEPVEELVREPYLAVPNFPGSFCSVEVATTLEDWGFRTFSPIKKGSIVGDSYEHLNAQWSSSTAQPDEGGLRVGNSSCHPV